MKTATINFKVDANLKKEAQKILKELGFSISSFLNASLQQVKRTKSLNFNLEESFIPNEETANTIRQSIADYKNNPSSFKSFSNTKDLFAHLDSLK